MISVSTIKGLLSSNNYEEIFKIMNMHFEGPDSTDIVAAGKVLGLIGAHCYYLVENPPPENLEGLVKFFVQGLNCLVQQKSEVKEENAKKGFENIIYVLAKALIRFKQTELCLEFCSNKIVLGFLSGFKNWLGSQEQYGIYFTKIILLAYTVPDPSLVARIIKVAVIFHIHGSNIDESTQFLKKVVVDTIGLLKRRSQEKSLTAENLEFVVRKISNVFDQLLTEHQLPDEVYGDIFQFHVYLIDSCHFNGYELKKELTSELLPQIITDFERCSKVLELVPPDVYSRFSSHWEIYLLKSYCVAAGVQYSKLDLPKEIARDFLQRNILMEKKFHQFCPEVIFKNNPAEKSFLLMVYVLSDLKLFKEAMLTLADCLVSTTPTSGHLTTVKKFVSIKMKALNADDPAKKLTLLQLFVEQKLLPPKSIFNIAKLEVVCYRRIPDFLSDRKMLVAWIKKFAQPGSVELAMALIEECWIYYFEDKPPSYNVKQCSKALELLKNCDSSSTVCMSVYKSLANFWLFIHKWKEITEKLTKDLESHSKIADQKEQKVNTEEEKEAMAAETDDIRPFEVSLNWSDEEKNLDHLVEALQSLETDCPSQEVILSDNWLASEKILLSMVSAIGDIFKLAGDERNQGRALKLLLKLSISFDSYEDKCSALLRLIKLFGMKESFKAEFLSSLKRPWSSQKDPVDLSRQRLTLGSAWGKYHLGDVVGCIKLCGNLLTDPICYSSYADTRLFSAEVYLLLTQCLHKSGSYISFPVPEELPDFCGGFSDILTVGPIEYVKKAIGRLQPCLDDPYDSQELGQIGSRIAIQNASHEARRIILLLHFWPGLPKEMKFFSNLLLEFSAEKFPATFTVIESLFYITERHLYFDSPSHAQVVLHEIGGILKGLLGEKGPQKHQGSVTQTDKVRLVLPDSEDVAASPSLVRKEPDLPTWMTKHKSNCSCYPCAHPTVLVFLVKFFTYQAVTYSLMSDFQGTFSLFKKLSTISKVVLETAKRIENCDVRTPDQLRLACFEALRWEIEIEGRLLQFEKCEKLLSELKLVLKSFDPATLVKFPVIKSLYTDLKFGVKGGLKDQAIFAKKKTFGLSPLPANHNLDKSLFHTPEVSRPSEDAKTPRRPTKKLTALPACVEAELDLMSKLKISDENDDDKNSGSSASLDSPQVTRKRVTKALPAKTNVQKTSARSTRKAPLSTSTIGKENGSERVLIAPATKRTSSRSKKT